VAPAPTLQGLIDSVRADAPGSDELGQLAQASRTAAQLEEVGDALLGHFVDQCRRNGRSWSEISTALGVSKQAAHKRFSVPAPTFERLTERARAVLGGAAEEARALGHGFVGSEHLLLALFEQDASLATQVLADAGITRVACEAEVLARIGRGAGPVTYERPFTPRAIEVLRGAVEEALRLGHNHIGTEHLLLAMFRDPDCLAALVLTALGATYDDVRGRLVEKMTRLPRG
jgi:hypothetical protein